MRFTVRYTVFAIATLVLALCADGLVSIAATPGPPRPRTTGQALPAPGTYEIDPPHTFAYFDARHEVVGLVRGRFDKIAGTITVAKDPAACSLDVTIDASSISTQNAMRDEDLRGPDFFDVNDFPTLTYRGHGIRRASGNAWTMNGSLTIRGVTKVVPLRIIFKGTAPTDPGKPTRVAFHGVAATKRAEFGMKRDLLKELGLSPAPGPDVDIELDSEALAQPPSP
jgi:polyisoprenoid-binding protein YceI